MVHRSRDRSGVKRSGHPFRLGAARALPERKRAKDDDNGDNDDAEEEEEEEEDLALAEEEAADDGSDQVVEDTLDDAAWPEKQERVGRDRSARAAKPKATGRTRRAVAAPARGATRSRSRSKATAPATAAIAASAASAAAVPTGRRSTIQQSSDEANEPKGRKGPPPAARRAASRASAAAAKRRGGRGARSLTTRKRSAPDADTPVRGRRASHRAKPPAPSSRDRPRVRSRGIPRSRDRAPSSSPPPKSDDEGGRGLPTSAGAGEHEAVSAGRSQAPPLGDDAPAWTAGVGTLRSACAAPPRYAPRALVLKAAGWSQT